MKMSHIPVSAGRCQLGLTLIAVHVLVCAPGVSARPVRSGMDTWCVAHRVPRSRCKRELGDGQ